MEPLVYNHPLWLKKEIEEIVLSSINPEYLMLIANSIAALNVVKTTGGPFGAIVVDETKQQIVGYGVNTSLSNGSIFHAEITAIWDAQSKLKLVSFKNTKNKYSLVSSAAPCSMCLGAIFWSGIQKLIVGASRDDVQSIGFDEGPYCNISYECNARNIELIKNVNQEECLKTLELYNKMGGKMYQ